jgi:hypothetical protein
MSQMSWNWCYVFADDTNLFFSHHDLIYLYNLTNIINIGLLNLSDWFKANKQSLNIKKSNYIIFRRRQKRQITSFPLYKNDHELHRTDHVVFLGVTLDEHLSWSLHISHIVGSVGIIYRASFCLTKVVLRTLYYPLVYPYLQYCATSWCSRYSSKLNRLLLLQKR